MIPNGIPESALRPVDAGAVAAIAGAAQTSCLAVKIGRFTPDKRWIQAIDAIAQLRTGGLPARLLMRGGMEPHGLEVLSRAQHHGLQVSEWAESLDGAGGVVRALAASGGAAVINLRSYIPDPVVAETDVAATAVLANSGHEPFGLVGLEAMAAGAVAFVGATGEEYARPYGNAIVIETDDGAEVAAALRGLVDRPGLARRLRRAARRDARDFAWPAVLEGMIERLRYMCLHQQIAVPEPRYRRRRRARMIGVRQEESVKAVVMAGGEGSRLRPLTSRYPKPLVPIVGTPVIEHNLRLLRDHGITDVVVTLHYLGAEIRNRLGDGSDLEMSIDYVVEDHPMGTAGSVRNAAHLLDETFLIISADCLTDIDLSAVIAEHRRRGAMASIVLTAVPNPLEYGVVVTDAESRIERFLEKPSWGEVFSDHVNTGTYVVEPEVLALVSAEAGSDWSGDVFPQMLARHQPLFGIVAEGYWCDIGTIPSFLQANWDALAGRVRCRIPGRRQGDTYIGSDVELGSGATIEGPAFLGDEVKLKVGTHLVGPVIIDKYAVVDANSMVTNSVLWPHVYVGESCRIREAILGRSVTVKNNSLIEEGAVIGDDCVIGQGSRIRAGVKLWPHKQVEPGSTVNELVVWAGEWRRGLFSSYGMSGLINVELTPEFCARLGAAFTATLPRGATISVARDQARSSRMILRAITAGMVSAGARVVDLDQLPVPVCQFATRNGHSDAGLHVLVSPLDQRSADIRLLDRDGLPIDKRSERRLENLFFREDFRRAAFYEMGDIEPLRRAARVRRAPAQQRRPGGDPPGRVPAADRLRLQPGVPGASRRPP